MFTASQIWYEYVLPTSRLLFYCVSHHFAMRTLCTIWCYVFVPCVPVYLCLVYLCTCVPVYYSGLLFSNSFEGTNLRHTTLTL